MRIDDLIHSWRGPLVGLIASWGAPWRDAAELALDTFTEAWLSRARFEGDFADARAVGPWLRGIAFRLHASWYRRHRRARVTPVEEADEVVLERGERDPGAAVRTAIDRLPGPQRTAVLMHYLEETSVRETAALLCVSEKVIEGRLYRARRRLRELLEVPMTTTDLTTGDGCARDAEERS